MGTTTAAAGNGTSQIGTGGGGGGGGGGGATTFAQLTDKSTAPIATTNASVLAVKQTADNAATAAANAAAAAATANTAATAASAAAATANTNANAASSTASGVAGVAATAASTASTAVSTANAASAAAAAATAAVASKADAPRVVQLTASRVCTAADFGTIFENSTSSNLTVTWPAGLVKPEGAFIGGRRSGNGTLILQVGAGVLGRNFPGTSVPLNDTDFMISAAIGQEVVNYDAETATSGPTVPLTVTAMQIPSGAPNTAILTLSRPVYGGNLPAATTVVVNVATVARVSSALVLTDSTHITVTFGGAAVTNGQAVTAAYTEGTSGRIVSLDSNTPLASFAATTVTNNVGASAPAQVTGLTLGTATATTQPLSWTAPAGSPTDYLIEYKASSSGTWLTFSDGVSTATSTTVTGLTASTSYDFRVSAINAAGTGTASATGTGSTAAAPSAPAQVTGLTLGTATSSTQPLSWSVPSGTPTDYLVEYKASSSGTWLIFADGTSTTPSTTVTGLAANTSYDFRVSAINANGTGPASATATGSTPAGGAAPGQVTGLTLGTPTGTTQPLSWTAPSGTPTDYIVEYKDHASSTWLTFADGTSAATSTTVTGLSLSTNYDYRVSASNGSGTGAASSVVTGATTSGFTTTALRLTTRTNQTESGTGPYTYSSTGDGGARNANAGMPLTSDGWIEVTATTIAGTDFMFLSPSNTVQQDLGNTGTYAVGIGSGPVDNFYVQTPAGVQTQSNPQAIQSANAQKWRYGFYGVTVTWEVWNGTKWTINHIFPEPRTATLYLQLRTFSSGNVMTAPAITTGVSTHFADQTVSLASDGNSLSVRTGETGGSFFDRLPYLAPLLGARATYSQVAVDGQTVTAMLSDHSDMDAAYVAGKTNIGLLNEGTNKIAERVFAGDTPAVAAAAAYNGLASYVTAIKAVHPWEKLLAYTCIKRQGGITDPTVLANLNQAIDLYNAYLLANYAALGLTGVIDLVTGTPWELLTTYTTAGFSAWQATYGLFIDVSPNFIHESDAGIDLRTTKTAAKLATLGIA